MRSVKSETLSKLILFGEGSLRYALAQYLCHYREEHPQQGIGNVIPFPTRPVTKGREEPIQCQE